MRVVRVEVSSARACVRRWDDAEWRGLLGVPEGEVAGAVELRPAGGGRHELVVTTIVAAGENVAMTIVREGS